MKKGLSKAPSNNFKAGLFPNLNICWRAICIMLINTIPRTFKHSLHSLQSEE